jgi:hypothetical protein
MIAVLRCRFRCSSTRHELLPIASPLAPTEKLVHPLARQTRCRNARTLTRRSRALGKLLLPPIHHRDPPTHAAWRPSFNCVLIRPLRRSGKGELTLRSNNPVSRSTQLRATPSGIPRIGSGSRTVATVPSSLSVAIITTKIPMLATAGFWSTAHEARTDYCMLLGLVFLLLVGGGPFSIDRRVEPS